MIEPCIAIWYKTVFPKSDEAGGVRLETAGNKTQTLVERRRLLVSIARLDELLGEGAPP